MKRMVVAGFAALALFAPASAKAFDWTRFYGGVTAGGAWGDASQSDITPFDTGAYDVRGGAAGAIFGFDIGAGRLVFGLAGDISAAYVGGSTYGEDGRQICISGECSAELDWLATARARLGWQATDRIMPYVTGGAAWGRVHASEGHAGLNLGGEGASTRAGYVVGAGVEAAINANWRVGIEYLFVDLGKGHVFDSTLVGDQVFEEDVGFSTNIVRLNVTYGFGGGPPGGGASAPFDWTGMYVGAAAGYGWDRATYDYPGAIPNAWSSGEGVLGGVYAGYNQQYGAMVLGVEADVEAAGVSGSYDMDRFSAGSASLDWAAAIRARAGVAVERTLVYVAGGLALGGFDIAAGDVSPPCCGFDGTAAGWTLGAGIEQAWTDHFVTRLEYRYSDFGGVSGALVPDFPGVELEVRNVMSALRAGVGYRF